MKTYLIDEDQLQTLKRVAARLYSENRLNGDDMRDLAHSITAVTNVCEQIEIPPSEVEPR